jgi:hypothetical protein
MTEAELLELLELAAARSQDGLSCPEDGCPRTAECVWLSHTGV